ncbi:uncharacterized protein YhfF [Alkalihalobacillus xiaoxiensis]|uniref:Uncharacterized protein YhfF n=1 Tax=Shouchella xiaoxiensis TaxID=766895 RepID=A0ABS2SVG7_9BACI|nr:ASCH domain-containing protein [Shouchella xiaoxiensis]MBM7839507.1 uncharacterized protein YhfF [Shouchella xiaoxiensis]
MMNATQLWDAFLEIEPNAGNNYTAWAFGDGTKQLADELAQLVISGKKTGTTSAYLAYEQENEPLPQIGAYSIILDGDEIPCAIIQSTEIEIIPYHSITEAHAQAEGHGDQTLASWQQAHEPFLRSQAEMYGRSFHPEMLVVFEHFKTVYLPSALNKSAKEND